VGQATIFNSRATILARRASGLSACALTEAVQLAGEELEAA
jgi:hypothetical protein